jgi:surface protein
MENIRDAFNSCESLNALDVSNWDTSNVINMRSTFSSCYKLTTLDVSKWDTSKVTDMHGLFFFCRNLTALDVSNFNTSNVTDMGCMFDDCRKLEVLDLSNFDTSSIVVAEGQDHGLNRFACTCDNLTTIILGENFGQTEKIPPFVGYISGYILGMFYAPSVPTTVIGANDVMKAYDWAGDGRTVTHFDSLYFSIDGHDYDFDYGMTLGEWCDSEYNTDGFWVDESSLHNSYLYGTEYVAWDVGSNDLINPGMEINLEVFCCFTEGTQVTISLTGETQSIETLK